MKTLTHFLLWNLGLTKAETQTTGAERDCLVRHAAGKKRLVEIGVWHGVTTARLRAVMSADGLLLAVDPFAPGRLGFSLPERIARREVAKVQNGNVRWVRARGGLAGQAYAKAGEEPIEFIFIDGDHTYEALVADWRAWSPLLAPGGIAALHDSCSCSGRNIDDAGSVRCMREVILADPHFHTVEIVDSLTVLRRH